MIEILDGFFHVDLFQPFWALSRISTRHHSTGATHAATDSPQYDSHKLRRMRCSPNTQGPPVWSLPDALLRAALPGAALEEGRPQGYVQKGQEGRRH